MMQKSPNSIAAVRSIFARILFVVGALTLALSGTAWAHVKVHGATTPAFALLKPQKEKIERLAGVEFTILPSSTLHGLADLVQGRADIAMLSEPLEIAARSLNKKKPGFIDPAKFVGRHVGNAFVQFIVHPSNPIKSLSKAQLAGLLSGRIKNWSELGGDNHPSSLSASQPAQPIK